MNFLAHVHPTFSPPCRAGGGSQSGENEQPCVFLAASQQQPKQVNHAITNADMLYSLKSLSGLLCLVHYI